MSTPKREEKKQKPTHTDDKNAYVLLMGPVARGKLMRKTFPLPINYPRVACRNPNLRKLVSDFLT